MRQVGIERIDPPSVRPADGKRASWRLVLGRANKRGRGPEKPHTVLLTNAEMVELGRHAIQAINFLKRQVDAGALTWRER